VAKFFKGGGLNSLKARADTVCMPIPDLPEAPLIKRFLTLLVKKEKR
jgi:hypothetical protein